VNVSGEARSLRKSPRGSLRKTGWRIALAAAALGVAFPAAAQFSESFKFLEAVKKGDGQTVQDALNKPGTQIINTRDVTTGETALHLVTKRKDKTWMAFLLEHGANPDVHDRDGVTPIQIAANLGFIDGVELLLQYKASPTEANDAGETPLITATHRRDLSMVKLLLAGGGDPERPDSSGRSARDYARIDNQDQLLAAFDAAAKTRSSQGPRKSSYGPAL
jgi:ankyrin repeat protein